jgi:hypothetical protein
MRTAPLALLLMSVAATGCTAAYDDGWADGCYNGELDGSMWGGVDAALCYSPNPVAGPVDAGPTRYDLGFFDGYNSCFGPAYLDAYDFATVVLEQDLGPCEEVF